MSTGRAALIATGLGLFIASCDSGPTAPSLLNGTYTLVSENDQPLPSDPGAPFGCCLTLSGSVTFTAGVYDPRTAHRNKNNGITFDNSEQGTYSRQGNTLSFTRTGGGGEGFPYLLAPGTLSADQQTCSCFMGTRVRARIRSGPCSASEPHWPQPNCPSCARWR